LRSAQPRDAYSLGVGAFVIPFLSGSVDGFAGKIRGGGSKKLAIIISTISGKRGGIRIPASAIKPREGRAWKIKFVL